MFPRPTSLRAMGEDPEDLKVALVVAMILGSLSKEYHSFVPTLETHLKQ